MIPTKCLQVTISALRACVKATMYYLPQVAYLIRIVK